MLGNLETKGHKGNLAYRLGVLVTNTRVNILKVINPRLSSCEGLSVPARILGWSGNEVKDSLPDLLLNEQLKNNIPKNISGWENFGFLQLFRKISYSVASCENLFLPSNLYKTC